MVQNYQNGQASINSFISVYEQLIKVRMNTDYGL